MAGASIGWTGAGEFAPDNGSGAPGTFAALSEGNKLTFTPKRAAVAADVLGLNRGKRRILGLRDIDGKSTSFWDPGDVAATNLLNALANSSRVWARVWDQAAKYRQASFYVSELQADSPITGLSTLDATLAFDGTPATPYVGPTSGTQLQPANALVPALGFKAKGSLSIGGTSTPFTAEAATQLGSSKSYQITATAKRVFDPAVPVVVKDNGSAVTPASGNLIQVDMLSGTATFAAGYSVTGPVTFDSGSYLPMSVLAEVTKMTSTISVDMKDSTTNAQSTGSVMRYPAQHEFKAVASVLGVASDIPQSPGGALGSSSWDALREAGTYLVWEHDLDGLQGQVFRSWQEFEQFGEDISPDELVMLQLQMSMASQTQGIYRADWTFCAP